MRFKSPARCDMDVVYRKKRRWREKSRSRYETAASRETDPRCVHATAGVLSHKVTTCRWRTSILDAATSWPATTPASSRSLFVISPCGLESETTRAATEEGKRCRQTIGCAVGEKRSKMTPPIPAAAASVVCATEAGFRTTSAMDVGRDVTLSASHCQSSRSSRIGFVNRTQPPPAERSADCRWEKSPSAPGRASIMLRSSPRSFCHCRSGTRSRPCTSAKISWRRVHR
jgi:hypothetical protein